MKFEVITWLLTSTLDTKILLAFLHIHFMLSTSNLDAFLIAGCALYKNTILTFFYKRV